MDGWPGIITAVGSVLVSLAGLLGVWLKWGHHWRGGTVRILEAHIARTQNQLDTKQTIIDELTEAVMDCEVYEEKLHGWMARQTDRLNLLIAQLKSLGVESGEALEMPPRRRRAKLGKAMASYYKNRTKYNTELAREVTDELLKKDPDNGEPVTY
jgi:septal ring factor EnvC (AmiA/AmiB activator)